jgi:hypothetical protein
MLRTEYEFTLPCGFADEEGTLHREGVMRRATAADEILPLGDPRVARNPAYLVVILLSRVVTRLGGLSGVNPKVVEGLWAADVAYLQELYNSINRIEPPPAATCPNCQHRFAPEVANAGG